MLRLLQHDVEHLTDELLLRLCDLSQRPTCGSTVLSITEDFCHALNTQVFWGGWCGDLWLSRPKPY